jgi:hypothetical protein
MSTSITAFHIQGHGPDEIEQALEAIFAGEERPRVLRIEGTFSAVLGRLDAQEETASYRYLICRPPAEVDWTPLLEVGNRTVGLEVELSRRLGGCAVFSVFVYGDVVSGYRLARAGSEVDYYLSDPTALLAETADESAANDENATIDSEAARGHPERFADLLPEGTSAEDFARVVLRPGWWEEHDQQTMHEDQVEQEKEDDEEDEVIDEADRMRCIALALELWGPSEYPFAQDAEDIPNKVVGPAIALAFA